jgi:hypothetical protein
MIHFFREKLAFNSTILKSVTCVELEAADEIRIANFLQILRSKQKINEIVVTSNK